MSKKQAENDALKDRLSRYREINLSVTGRKSGRTISQPVWFVLDDDKVYLLPVRGSETQWYKNVLKDPLVGSERVAQTLNFEPFRLLIRHRFLLWSRNSAPSMGPAM